MTTRWPQLPTYLDESINSTAAYLYCILINGLMKCNNLNDLIKFELNVFVLHDII